MDVLATVLEEMPPFPEKESSGLLNLLKRKRPGRVPDNPGLESGTVLQRRFFEDLANLL